MKQPPFFKKIHIFALVAVILVGGIFFWSKFNVFAFIGPTQNPSGGYGALATDASNDVSVGTSTTISGTKFLVVGSTTNSAAYAAEVLESNSTALLLLRDDGAVSIETSTLSAGNTIIGGNLTVGGTVSAASLGASTMSAANVSAGQFGSGTGGGNYEFTGKLAVGTTTASGTIFVVGTTTIAGNLFDGSGNKYSTSTGGGGVATTTPFTVGDVVVAQTGSSLTTATTSKTIYDNSPTATDDIPFNIDEQAAITLRSVECLNDVATGNTATFNIIWGTTRNAASHKAFTSNQACTATSTTSVLSPNGSTTIAAGSIVRLVMSAASSTGITVQLEY